MSKRLTSSGGAVILMAATAFMLLLEDLDHLWPNNRLRLRETKTSYIMLLIFLILSFIRLGFLSRALHLGGAIILLTGLSIGWGWLKASSSGRRN